MLGYAPDNATGTFQLLNLSTKKVVGLINVCWLNMNYEQYMASKSVINYRDNDKSDDAGDFDNNTQQNQGAIDAGPNKKMRQTTTRSWKEITKITVPQQLLTAGNEKPS